MANATQDPGRPLRVYDGRSKDKEIYRVSKVLFRNERVGLCVVDAAWLGADREVLFSVTNGRVLSENMSGYYVTDGPITGERTSSHLEG